MLISTKGRYALRMMIHLARTATETPISLKEVSEREGISLKYLEQVARPLAEAGLVKGTRGKAGGYVLALDAADITAGQILRAAEGTTAPVTCLGEGSNCPRMNECSTIAFWRGLDNVIDSYVNGVTLASLCEGCH